VDRRAAFPPDFDLILASQSPRRHSFLRDIGVPFRVALSEGEEASEGAGPRSIAEVNAKAKLDGVILPEDVAEGAFVLATDTIVTVDGRVMGKATSEEEAAAMLTSLSGRTHQVVSGVALARMSGRAAQSAGAPRSPRFPDARVDSAVTDVTFMILAEADIQAYVASGEWRGKAGAYAIQGLAGLYSSGIRGEYSNVVGLPLHLVAQMFRGLGFDLVRRTWV
jgi:septum formation protein